MEGEIPDYIKELEIKGTRQSKSHECLCTTVPDARTNKLKKVLSLTHVTKYRIGL
jgi:hypothetical protein